MFENQQRDAHPQQDKANSEPRWLVTEFFYSAFDAAVVNKVRGVTQLFGADVSVPKEPHRNGMSQVAHLAGTSAGEILDFVILSKVAGAGAKRLSTQFAGRSYLAAKLESEVTLHTLSSASVGLVNGAFLTPTGPNETPWRRLGNGVTEAATFGTLGGISACESKALSGPFISRIQSNFVSGAAAGVVHAQVDALTRGRIASLNDTADSAAGWAVGNVVLSEGLHSAGKGWAFLRELTSSRKQVPTLRTALGELDGAKLETLLPELNPSIAKEIPAVAAVKEVPDAVGVKEPQVVQAPEQPTVELKREGSDRPFVQPMLNASETVSMRELCRRDSAQYTRLLEDYYPRLEESFPLEGEIESIETYKNYLESEGTWDMVVLRDDSRNVIGGIQYQIVDVAGEALNKAAWGEHIWLAPEARNYTNFRGLINVAKTEIKKAGGDIVFMEFNNPDKMTQAQIDEDSSAGISPQDREKIWGRTGIHVPVDSTGNMLEYGQPSMGGQPAVEFLSLGFIGTESLSGKSLSKADYLKLAQTAHSTIEGVDVNVDPTVRAYTDAVEAMKDETFTFVPLAAIAQARDVALKAREGAMVQSIAKALTENISPELRQALEVFVRSQKAASPEAVQPLIPDALHKALDRALGVGKKPGR